MINVANSGGWQQHRSGEPSTFAAAVLAVVATSRPGEILTYGEVAREAGRPGAARAVGAVLRDRGGALPWWRVVAANGRLVPGSEADHARRLIAEGVTIVGGRVRAPSGS